MIIVGIIYLFMEKTTRIDADGHRKEERKYSTMISIDKYTSTEPPAEKKKVHIYHFGLPAVSLNLSLRGKEGRKEDKTVRGGGEA